jgi:hypothetical protein
MRKLGSFLRIEVKEATQLFSQLLISFQVNASVSWIDAKMIDRLIIRG